MDAVTASTKRDSEKIDLAGVDAGAKILVGLNGGAGAVAAAAAAEPTAKHTTKHAAEHATIRNV
jgi:hypothetical protein